MWPRSRSTAEHALAFVAHAEGDHPAALAGWRRALGAAVVARAPRLEGIMNANLGRLHYDLGALDEAKGFSEAARTALAQSDDRFHLARVDLLDGLLAARGERHDEAEARLSAALDVTIEHEDLDGELEAREALTEAALLRGDHALASRRAELFAAAARFTDDVAWGPRVEALRGRCLSVKTKRGASLALSRDGRRMVLGDVQIDLSRRGPLRRVLVALVAARVATPGRCLTTAEVLHAGWLGEKMFPESGAARVYMAVRRLRVLGIEALLTTVDDGYALDPAAEVTWLDDV